MYFFSEKCKKEKNLKNAHLERLLKKHGNEVALQLRFFVEAHENDARKTFVEHFFRLSLEQSPDFCRNALVAWYKSQHYTTWATQFPLQQPNRDVQPLLEAHEAWYKSQGIGITPQLWINGKYLPNWYNAEDLLEFTPHLIQSLVKV